MSRVKLEQYHTCNDVEDLDLRIRNQATIAVNLFEDIATDIPLYAKSVNKDEIVDAVLLMKDKGMPFVRKYLGSLEPGMKSDTFYQALKNELKNRGLYKYPKLIESLWGI